MFYPEKNENNLICVNTWKYTHYEKYRQISEKQVHVQHTHTTNP